MQTALVYLCLSLLSTALSTPVSTAFPSMPRKVRGVPPTLGEDGLDGSGWMDVQPRTLSAAGKHKLSFI